MKFVSIILISLFLIYAVDASEEGNEGVRTRGLKKKGNVIKRRVRTRGLKKGGSINPLPPPALPARRTGTFVTVLNAAQELILCDSDASGNGIFTYEDGMLCAYVSYDGLKNGDVEDRSHIHGPGAIGETYSGTVLTFYNSNNPGMEGETSGTNKSGCYNLDEINEAKGYDEGTLEEFLFDGLLLVNIHTKYCDKGELRGQILPLLVQ